MRVIKSYSNSLALVLVVAALVSFHRSASAQAFHIAPATGTDWRLNDLDDVSAANWTALNYDDSGGNWRTAPSGFSYETGANDVTHVQTDPSATLVRTQLRNPSNDPAEAQRHATYIRKKFNWTGPTAGAVLSLHTRWDDSGVVYLNGQVVFNNTQATPPLGWIQYTRGAIGSGTEGTVDEPAVVDVSGILVAGENVLAAEVHQVNNSSSDIVMVVDATIVLPFAPTNTVSTQPTNRTILQSRSSVLQVFADGYPTPEYQWFVGTGPNFAAILDATNATLLVTNDSPVTTVSNFYCRVSNNLGFFNSRTSVVTFTSDTMPPTVVRATADSTFTQVRIEFSEGMSQVNTEDSFAYQFSGGLSLAGNGVLSPSGKSVLLTLAGPMAPDTVYTVTIASSVSDLAGNPIADNTSIQFRSWVPSSVSGLVFEAFNGTPAPTTAGTMTGNAVSVLTSHPSYPNDASEVLLLSAFDTRTDPGYLTDAHEAYGGRIRGLFIPPESGNWILYLSSDDASELWFNANGADASGKVRVAQQSGCCNAFTYQPGGLSSGSLPLIGGQAYYIEALYKEGTGGDLLEVAAALEGQPVPAGGNHGQNTTCPSCMPASYIGAGALPAGAAGTFTITQQPVSTQVVAAATATFHVGVNQSLGLPVLYQWLRDGQPILGAHNSSYSFIPAIGDSGAMFSCAVTNLGGAGTISSSATLTVVPDTFAPFVVSSSIANDGSSVTITFNEGMDAGTAGDPFNYTINGAGASMATLSADLRTVTVVPASPLTTPCLANQIVIKDAKDIALNTLTPNPTTVSLTTPLVLVGNNDTQMWRYDFSGTDFGTGWVAPGFDDSAWGMGPGPLALEDGSTMPPGWPIRTTLTGWAGARITTYFRTHFNLATDPKSITSLELSEVIDDASVAYINGVEVYRLRVDAGPLTYNTQANAGSPSEAPHPVEGPFIIPNSVLLYGDNVLAIRVQQSGTTSSDIVMGAQLIGKVSACVSPLYITHSGSTATLTWPDPTFSLVSAPDVNGPWNPFPGSSGVTVSTSTGNKFFRLVK